MFTLTIHDKKGTELKEGDIVEIHNGRSFTFWAEVKYLEDEQVITPFHTFSFHSVEKVDTVPVAAVKSSEERYGIWFLQDAEHELVEDDGQFEKFLASWRECEFNLNQRMYRIQKLPQ